MSEANGGWYRVGEQDVRVTWDAVLGVLVEGRHVVTGEIRTRAFESPLLGIDADVELGVAMTPVSGREPTGSTGAASGPDARSAA